VIIYNLDFISVTVKPFETYTPLVIDAYAVLTVTVSAQGFQPVSRWHKQILQRSCPVQIIQFASCRSLKSLKTSDRPIVKKRFGVFVLEALYHQDSSYRIYGITSSVIAGQPCGCKMKGFALDKGPVPIRYLNYCQLPH